MPSPDLLPTGREMPVAPPPALEDILSGASRRRRRKVGAAGAATLAAVAGAAVILVPGAGTDSLRGVTPATSPTPAASATAEPAPRVTGAAPRRSGPDTAGRRAAAAAAAATAAAPGAVAIDHTGDSGVSPTPTGGPATAEIGPPHRMPAYDAARACNGSGPTAATGWCSYYTGATSGTGGDSVVLSTDVCRLPGQGDGTLVSSTGLQADFAVGRKAYPATWTWSHGRSFASDATSLDVPAGECVEWFVSWRVVDDAGGALKPGTYYLDASPQAVPPRSDASAYASNPVTFTVD